MASSPQLFSDVQYASYLIYPARPTVGRIRTPAEDKAKALVLAIKQLRVDPRFEPPDIAEWAVARMAAQRPTNVLHDFFGRGSAHVIAAPGAGFTLKHSASAPVALCFALVKYDLAAKMLPRIIRTAPVPKSAYAAPGARPPLRTHFDTMSVPDRALDANDDIIVVDDVVTKGTTLLAAVARVREAYPQARVRAFAIARTSEVTGDRVYAPVVGTVYQYFDRARRQPW